MAQKLNETYTTPQRWFQGKRVPLYLAVGTGLAMFATLWTRKGVSDPTLLKHKDHRQSGLPDAASTGAVAKGEEYKEKQFGRDAVKAVGLDDQHQDGIMPNRKIVHALDSVLGGDLKANPDPQKNKK